MGKVATNVPSSAGGIAPPHEAEECCQERSFAPLAKSRLICSLFTCHLESRASECFVKLKLAQPAVRAQSLATINTPSKSEYEPNGRAEQLNGGSRDWPRGSKSTGDHKASNRMLNHWTCSAACYGSSPIWQPLRWCIVRLLS